MKSEGLTPTKLLPLADAATRSMTVDPGLGSADKLLGFAMSLKDIDLHNTKFVTVPWRYEGSRVAIVEPDADALWAALRADRTIDGLDASGEEAAAASPAPNPSPSPSVPVSGAGISVGVYNGTRVTGLAARVAGTLADHDFTVTGTWTASAQGYGASVIEYGPGQEEHARTLARFFPGALLQSVPAPGINVIVGMSYANDPPPAPSAAAPTGVPSQVAEGARSADDDLCSNLSYG